MQLIIDLGNTAAKVAIFEKHTLLEKHTFASVDVAKDFIQKQSVDAAMISSVNVDPQQIVSLLPIAVKSWIISPSLPVPIHNKYRTPHTLGADRLAAACGALHQHPGKNCLIIDAGTCITYDMLDSTGTYHGGAIAPGLMMRFQAMNTFTARLPLVNPVLNAEMIGDTTETCLQSGVINGMIGEINGFIDAYGEKFPNLHVIFCGGDTRFFENKVKGPIFASPDLVLMGLNSILLYNVKY